MAKYFVFVMVLISCSYSWATDQYQWGTLDRAEVEVQLYKQYGDRPDNLIFMGIITQLRVTKRDVRLIAYNDKYLMVEECQFPKTRFFIKDGKSVEEEIPDVEKIIKEIRKTILKKDLNENDKSTFRRITCFMTKSPLYRLPEAIAFPNKLLFNSVNKEGNIIGDTIGYRALED